MSSPKIDPSEHEIEGKWIFDGDQVLADEACLRIEHLTSEYLVQIAISANGGGWEVLFRDPKDGRYWEKCFPNGEVHGGGPPCLRYLDEVAAREKYSLS